MIDVIYKNIFSVNLKRDWRTVYIEKEALLLTELI
jgi:hypothetical protein